MLEDSRCTACQATESCDRRDLLSINSAVSEEIPQKLQKKKVTIFNKIQSPLWEVVGVVMQRSYFATTRPKPLKSVQNLGSRLTNQQMGKFLERFSTLSNFVGVQVRLFLFFNVIGLFEIKDRYP